MRRPRFTVITFVLLAFAAGVFFPPAVARADEQLELSFDEEMQLEEFLRTVSRMTAVQFVWNPMDKNIRGKKIMGGVNLKGERRQFLELVRGLLTFYELVMIPVGPEGHSVTLVMDARQTSVMLKLKPEYVVLTEANLRTYEHADGLFITTTIQVEHMTDLRNARNALTRIVTGQNIGNVTEVPASNAFVVTDFAPNVVAIYRLLKEMDKPSMSSSTTSGRLQAITLKHARALDLASVLEDHFQRPQLAVSGGRGAVPQGPSAPRITADNRTNQVLVSGTDAQIRRVQEAITLLDVPVQGAKQQAYIIRLTHIGAEEAANVLVDLMSGGTLWQSTGPTRAQARIIAHESRNALLIRASAEAYDAIRRMVEEMDTKADEK